jgi:hypothetical protein
MSINLNKPGMRVLISSKSVFLISLLVLALTIVAVWLFGLGQHRSLFVNSLLSTTILSLTFFLFVSIGLYKGIKLKDNLGEVIDKVDFKKIPEVGPIEAPSGVPDLDDAEGIIGIVLGILLWLLITGLFLVCIWWVGAIFWFSILLFAAMLYWIFFRALRLVFKNGNRCKNKLKESVLYGLGYTILYNCWIYLIIFVGHSW